MSSSEQPLSLMGALEALVKEQAKEGYRNGPVIDDEGIVQAISFYRSK